jgi:hypothetical protein
MRRQVMSGARRLLILGGLLFAIGSAAAAEPDRVYVSGGYRWAPGYYAGGVYHAAPAYYYFAPGYYTPAPRAASLGEPVHARSGVTPGRVGYVAPGKVGYYARQRTRQGVNPNYYHGYLHPNSEDMGGP